VVLDSILPKLIAFKAIMQIRNIEMKKEKEQNYMKEKAENKGYKWAKA
jgi:hypothetical protein